MHLCFFLKYNNEIGELKPIRLEIGNSRYLFPLMFKANYKIDISCDLPHWLTRRSRYSPVE